MLFSSPHQGFAEHLSGCSEQILIQMIPSCICEAGGCILELPLVFPSAFAALAFPNPHESLHHRWSPYLSFHSLQAKKDPAASGTTSPDCPPLFYFSPLCFLSLSFYSHLHSWMLSIKWNSANGSDGKHIYILSELLSYYPRMIHFCSQPTFPARLQTISPEVNRKKNMHATGA